MMMHSPKINRSYCFSALQPYKKQYDCEFGTLSPTTLLILILQEKTEFYTQAESVHICTLVANYLDLIAQA